MKNFIETLNAMKKGESGINAKRAIAIEIAYKIIGDLRKSESYKSARNFIFNEKGNDITEKSVKVISEDYGFSITASQVAEKESVDYKAIVEKALQSGMITEEFVSSVPKKITSTCVTFTTKELKK